MAIALVSVSLTGLPSQAVPDTCQGRAVTGSAGTEGDDVLVVDTGSTAMADGLGGNDLICLVGYQLRASPDPTFFLDAGAGDDVVVNLTTTTRVPVTVVLGTGKDTYTGGASVDTVHAGLLVAPTGVPSDTEADVISTDAGDDLIHSGSVLPGSRNEDAISTGSGRDTVLWSGVGGSIDNGPDPDHLQIHASWSGAAATQAWTTDVVVDNRTRRATSGDEVLLSWTNVDDFSIPISTRLTEFRGSDLRESLLMSSDTEMGRAPVGLETHIHMGAGNDVVSLDGLSRGLVDAGAGNDTLWLRGCHEAVVRLDGTSRCRTRGREVSVPTVGWENADVGSRRRLRLVGTSARNRLVGWTGRGGQVRISGRAAADQIHVAGGRKADVAAAGGRGRDTLRGHAGSDRLRGGPGADDLKGFGGSDHLIGGPGHDTVDGGSGRDVCLGEVLARCELPRR